MTSHADDTSFIQANFETISRFGKDNYQENMDLIVTTLEGTNPDFDESGMKSLLPNEIWNIQPENQLANGAIRGKPMDPAPGIPPGPSPIEPAPPLTAAEMNYSALCLNHYQARIAANSKANGNVQRHRAAKTIIKMTLINRTIALGDQTAHALLTNDRATNQPNPRISAEDLLQNFYDGYSVPNDAAKDVWAATFDQPRNMDQPFKEYISRWTVSRAKLNSTDRICTDYDIMRKFIIATEHDPRVKEFMVELRRLHPGTSQTWAQMMALATIQDANLDADIKLVHSAMVGTTTIPIPTINVGGSAGPATIPSAGAATATKKPSGAGKAYCFIHGTKFHASDKCKMIAINERAYPYDPTNLIKFTTSNQVDQAKLSKSAKFEVAGIGKGNQK